MQTLRSWYSLSFWSAGQYRAITNPMEITVDREGYPIATYEPLLTGLLKAQIYGTTIQVEQAPD